MGDAQSAQRGEAGGAGGGDGGDGGDGGEARAQLHEPIKSDGQISEFNGNADGSIADVHCEDKIIAAGLAIPSPDGDVSEKIRQEETPLVNVEIAEKEVPDANEDECLDLTEMDAKQNDINESFKRFFSNIGLKFTVKKGSGEPATDETNEEEPNKPGEETAMETAMETAIETSIETANTEHNTDVNIAQEAYDNDSTTCPTLTDGTSEGVLENAETKEEVESDGAMSPEGEDAAPEEDPEEAVVVSPIKRFFTTGIFSGIRKKKKPEDEEPVENELKDMGNREDVEKTEQQDKDEVSLGVEAGEPNGEPEILSSQEKVQASPLKRLLSGSNLKKLSKKPRSRKSSDAKLSDSGEHVSDNLVSSSESAGKQTEKGSGQPSADAGGEEDSAWATFKKLLTPKRRLKKYSMTNEETHVPDPVEEPKPSEGGQISDHSADEGKKRKDSAVSWEAVLCGSGRRRSRKTSDSEDESPQDANKQNVGSKQGPELAQENEISAEADGALTWKSLKRLVTPKRKAKDDVENKENAQSDSEIPQDDSFSVKKLLPGRKKRKSTEARQDQVSSDEADKDAASGDEDSETPAVVPLSEFDAVEMEVHVQTQADVESPKEADHEQDLLDQNEPVPPTCDGLQTEEVQDAALENKESSETPAADEEAEELTDSISKPQLSDIPEEATPASLTEEAARDDTIAEDLMEITSDAVTAPEPLDTTLADETEMISAVSQLSSESSGNTTPVPADYAVKETDLLLHQVVETIASPKEAPVCSDEPRSENIAVSELRETLEKFDEERPTILEKHRSLDATPEVSESVSTSEVPTEEFKTAEIAIDDVTNQDESIGELESVDSLLSHHLVECPSEGNVAISTDIVPESESIIPDDGSLVEARQTETQEADSDGTMAQDKDHPPMELQELEGAGVATLDSKEGSTQSLEKDVISEDTTTAETIEMKEDTVPLPEADQENKELVQEAVQTSTLDAEEVKPEEPKQTECEVSAEPQNEELPAKTIQEVAVLADTENSGLEKEPISEETLQVSPEPVDAPKPVQEPEVLAEVQAQTLDSEPEREVISEDVPAVTTGEDKKQEPEEKLPTEAEEAKDVQEPQVLEALDSEEGSVRSLEKEAISEDIAEGQTRTVTDTSLTPVAIPAVETVQHEPKQEAEAQPEEELQVEVVKTEEGQSDLVTEDAVTETSVGASVQKQEILEVSEDQEPKSISQDVEEESCIPEVTAELQSAISLINEDASNIQDLEETADTLDSTAPPVDNATLINEPENGVHLSVVQARVEEEKESKFPETEVNAAVVEHVEVTQSLLCNFKEVSAEISDVSIEELSPVAEPPIEKRTSELEFKEEVEMAAPLEKDVVERAVEGSVVVVMNVPLIVDASRIDLRNPEVLESVVPVLDSEEGSGREKEKMSKNVPEGERVPDESEEKTETLDATTPEPEVLGSVQGPLLDSQARNLLSLEQEVMSEVGTDEPKEKPKSLSEASPEPEQVQEPEVLGSAQVPLPDSQASNLLSLEQEVMSEVGTDELKEKPKSLSEASPEPEQVQEPEVVEPVQVQIPDSKAGNLLLAEKEVTSALTTTVAEELISVTEASPEPVDAIKTEKVQEPEVLEAVPILPVEVVQVPIPDSEAGNLLLAEKEVTSEVIPAVETVPDEPKEKTIPLTEASPEPVDATKPEQVQEPEVLEPVQVQVPDSKAGDLLLAEKEVTSALTTAGETVIEELISVTEASPEPVDATKPEQVQEPEVLEAVPIVPVEVVPVEVVQVPMPDSEAGDLLLAEKEMISALTTTVTEELKSITEASPEPVDNTKPELEKEVMSEVIPAVETVPDEPKEETILLTEASPEPMDATKPEQVQEPEVLEAVPIVPVEVVQVPIPDSEASNLLLAEKEVTLEVIPAVETVPDEPKEETSPLTEASPEPVDATKPEQVQEPEIVEAVQVSISEASNLPSLEKEVTSEVIPAVETVPDEPKEETIPLTEVSPEPVDATKPEQVQEPEVLETVQIVPVEVVQVPVPDSEAGNLLLAEKEVTSALTISVTEEPISVTEASPELSDATEPEQVKEPEIVEAVQVSISEAFPLSLEKEVTSEVIPLGETVPDEPKEETIPLTEASPEPVDATKPERVQEPEVIEAVQVQIPDSKASNLLSLEKEVMSEVITVGEVTDERKEVTISLTEASPEPVDATKPERVQEPEIVEAVQVSISEASNLLSVRKEVTAEVIPAVATVPDEPKEETIPLTEASPEPADATKPERVQEPEVIEAVQVQIPDSEGGNLLKLEKEVTSDVIPAVADEPPEDILPVVALNIEVVQEPQIPKQEAEARQEELKTEEPQLLEDVPKPKDNVASVPDGLESEVMAQLDHYLDTAEDQKTKSSPQDVGTEQEVPTSEVKDEVQTSASHLQEPEKPPKSPTPCVDKAAVTREPEHEVHLGAICARVEAEKEVELPGSDVTAAAFDHAVAAQVVVCNFKEVSAEIPGVSIEQTSPVSIPLVYHVPTVESQDDHRIQVQVVDDAESAEITGDVVQAQIAEQKQLRDGPCEMVEKLEQLSATPESEEELVNEENNVSIHEVTQHAKENLPGSVPDPESVTLEQLALKQPDVMTEVKEGQKEAPVVAGQQESEDFQQEPDVPGGLEVPTLVQKDDPKIEQEKSEEIYERAQIIQHQILTSKVESPSSPDPPATQRSEPLENTDTSEVGIQENKNTNKHATLTKVAFQATVTTEPATELESKEKVVITMKTALLAMAQVAQIDAETVTPIVQENGSQSQETVDALVRQKDEDQDVWLDAEDVVYTQEEVKVASLEPDDKTGSEEEVETAPKDEEEEGPRVMHMAVETGGTDSEEDFAIALEQPEPESACVATMK